MNKQELNKVTIPQFVAGWIKHCKLTSVNLYHAFEMGDLYFCNYANQKDYSKLKEFFKVKGNQELFAHAWLDGYTVEKEKRYLVKVKGIVNALSFLSYHKNADIWTVTDKNNSDGHRAHHTRKELEEANFGWVFDCPGIEIEEVEE